MPVPAQAWLRCSRRGWPRGRASAVRLYIDARFRRKGLKWPLCFSQRKENGFGGCAGFVSVVARLRLQWERVRPPREGREGGGSRLRRASDWRNRMRALLWWVSAARVVRDEALVLADGCDRDLSLKAQ